MLIVMSPVGMTNNFLATFFKDSKLDRVQKIVKLIGKSLRLLESFATTMYLYFRIDTRDSDRRTALMYAAAAGRYEFCEVHT
jgi:hypothetical protein